MARKTAPLSPTLEGILEHLGENIRLARLRRRISTTTLAERAGMSRPTLRAVERGERAIHFAFDENIHTLLKRTRAMGLEFAEHIKQGRLRVQQIDPAEIAPGELANKIVECVEDHGIRLIVLDSLNGYVNAMPQEDYINLHLHELLSYLNQRGVVTIMTLAQQGLVGPMGVPVDVSYLADTVILTRYFEAGGAVRKAISIIKKRSGAHESTIRELEMTASGIRIGEALDDFHGVLTGVPRFVGSSSERLRAAE